MNGAIEFAPQPQKAGEKVDVTLKNIADAWGNAAGDGSAITFAASNGTVTPLNYTANGSTTAELFATSTTGVNVTAFFNSNAIATANATLQPLEPYAATLEFTPLPQTAGSNVTVTARAFDKYGNRAADGTEINFAASAGSITFAATTAAGIAFAQLNHKTASAVQVTAAFNATALATSTASFIAGSAARAILQATPNETTTGTNATVTAFVTDAFGNQVADGTQFNFTATDGASITATNTTFRGNVEAQLTHANPATVTAAITRDGIALNNTTIAFKSGAPASAQIAAFPGVQTAGVNATISVTNITDETGRNATDGYEITFIASSGTITPNNNTQGAQATAQLSSMHAGTTLIEARHAGTVLATVVVQYIPASPQQAKVSANATAVTAGGAVEIPVQEITDAFGNTVANGTQLSFATTLGTIAYSKPVWNGESAAMASSKVSGTAVVTVSFQGNELGNATITFARAPVSVVTAFANATRTPAGTQVLVTINATDAFGNPAAEGTPAAFYTTHGSITPSNATKNGIATATIYANTPGTATVSGVVNGTATANFTLEFLPACSITATPSQARGAFQSLVLVNFTAAATQLPTATIDCGTKTKIAPLAGDYTAVLCDYPAVATQTAYAITASSGSVACTTTVTVQP